MPDKQKRIPQYKPAEKKTFSASPWVSPNGRVIDLNHPDTMVQDFSTFKTNPLNPKTHQQIRLDSMKKKSEIPISVAGVTQPPVGKPQEQSSDNPYMQIFNEYNQLYKQSIEDEKAARKSENSRKRIAAIADAISSFANLYGVSAGGYSMPLPSAYSLVSNEIAEDQRLRQADARLISSRLDDQMNRLLNQQNRDIVNDLAMQRIINAQDREERLRNQYNSDAVRKDRAMTQKENELAFKKEKELNDREVKLINAQAALNNSQARGVSANASYIRANAYKDYQSNRGTSNAERQAEIKNGVSVIIGDWDNYSKQIFKWKTGKDWDSPTLTAEEQKVKTMLGGMKYDDQAKTSQALQYLGVSGQQSSSSTSGQGSKKSLGLKKQGKKLNLNK